MKIVLYKNNKLDRSFKIDIDEIVKGYIQSEYYQDYVVHRGMPLYIACVLGGSYENFSDYNLIIEYYSKNRDRIAEELGIIRAN